VRAPAFSGGPAKAWLSCPQTSHPWVGWPRMGGLTLSGMGWWSDESVAPAARASNPRPPRAAALAAAPGWRSRNEDAAQGTPRRAPSAVAAAAAVARIVAPPGWGRGWAPPMRERGVGPAARAPPKGKARDQVPVRRRQKNRRRALTPLGGGLAVGAKEAKGREVPGGPLASARRSLGAPFGGPRHGARKRRRCHRGSPPFTGATKAGCLRLGRARAAGALGARLAPKPARRRAATAATAGAAVAWAGRRRRPAAPRAAPRTAPARRAPAGCHP
jgi:hypothetical protein